MRKLSICIVSLDCWNVLAQCLETVASSEGSNLEVILVDNGSSDGTVDLVRQRFPWVRVFANRTNLGFTRATNQAIIASSGEYIVWLNPDTLVQQGSLPELCRFLEERPRAGIVGPRVLNADGTFQPQCRRGMPTPLAIASYLLRMDRIWRSDPRIGQYLMTHMPDDQAVQVVSVSGCCLMARRQVWEDVGPLDDHMFGFGEDIDWCVRSRKAGWEVWYYPGSVIVHLKGKGGAHTKPYHKIWGMHQAMWVFYKKHLMHEYPWLLTALVFVAGLSSLAVSVTGSSVRRMLGVVCLHAPVRVRARRRRRE